MNFSNQMAKIWHFRELLNFYPTLESEPEQILIRSTSNNMIYAEGIVLRFYRGHFQDSHANVKTFFGYFLRLLSHTTD